ncbi:acyl carrier protein [Methylocaldum szegediense]|uniref:Acyl carrier protein n=1 Tax=Methylocaldum szegediense TaxID=73780 RepID=A0ABM9I770_9GAMM|nr:acyl carrier protein [Methylocaldum szegediense]CAI8936221.1 acyl carrier protein [Methylocaldum szegediense]
MQIEQIKTELKNIFADRLNMDIAAINASDDDGLFDPEGWNIDSIDVIDIVLGVEQTFGVKLKQDEEVQTHFRTLNTLAEHIGQLLAAKA